MPITTAISNMAAEQQRCAIAAILNDFSRLWNTPEHGYSTHQMRPRRPRSRIAKSHLARGVLR
jgi:hypothetical protein